MSKPKSRAEVLRLVRSVVGDSHEEHKVPRRRVFCPSCGDDITAGNDKPGQKAITCPNNECNYQGNRGLIFDQRVTWKFNEGEYHRIPKRELVHFSVGTVIKREQRFLLFRRTLHPVGKYTIPAGHLEQGEDPRKFAIQEAYEESGLGILSCDLTFDDLQMPGDECRRSVDHHVWKVYLCESIGDPRMSYEADVIGWYGRDEVAGLPLTSPVEAIFRLL